MFSILNPIYNNVDYYRKYCKNKSNKTPGTPRNPAIKAVIGLIAIVIPIKPPKMLRKNSITAPIMPLIINLITIFIGTTNSIPII